MPVWYPQLFPSPHRVNISGYTGKRIIVLVKFKQNICGKTNIFNSFIITNKNNYVLNNLDIKKIKIYYSYDSETALVEAIIAITKIKHRFKDTLEPTSIIINVCTNGILQAVKFNIIFILLSVK